MGGKYSRIAAPGMADPGRKPARACRFLMRPGRVAVRKARVRQGHAGCSPLLLECHRHRRLLPDGARHLPEYWAREHSPVNGGPASGDGARGGEERDVVVRFGLPGERLDRLQHAARTSVVAEAAFARHGMVRLGTEGVVRSGEVTEEFLSDPQETRLVRPIVPRRPPWIKCERPFFCFRVGEACGRRVC